ncbi:hypothetical protein [Rhizobium sp. Root483D2]|uniref:hypothetical protein n=1 Tax=Rhizobium sp. Root483D2 TaxID=1736545 RepID=UPI000AAA4DAE|nr:hypothetical protein [Rhizobium sp. Root483D2]
MDYHLDELGFLQNPWFHDGGLTGITVEDDVVKLGLKMVDGQQFSLTLSDTVAFVATDFQLGNIIFDIRLSKCTDITQDRLSALYPSPHQSAAERFHDAYGKAIDEKRAEILIGKLTLFELTSSYGCEIVALCREVSVSR